MSSCMSDVSLAFQAGGICGGNGHCVNSSLTPGLILCLCNTGYSGASDFFDNRVEQLPDGTWLSFSCNSSRIGSLVMWSFFMVCTCARVISLLPMFRQMWRRHFADPEKIKQGLWEDFPLRIITFDTFAVTIPMFITGVCKLYGMTFGTDILPTVTLCLTVTFFNLGVLALTQREFKIFVKGTMNPKEALKAQHLRDFLKAFGFCFCFGVMVVPSLWALSLNKALGPIDNQEDIAIYLRNLGAIVFALIDMFTTSMIRRRVKKLLTSTSGMEDTAVVYIVKKMDAEMRTYIIFIGTLGVVYGIFVIPFFLQFQTYIIAFIVGLGALRHSGKAFMNEADAKAFELTLSKSSSKHGSKAMSQDLINQGGEAAAVSSLNSVANNSFKSGKLVPTSHSDA